MAKASDVNAGGASVRIGTDDAGYMAGLTRAEKRLKAFGANAVAIGTKLAGLGIGLGTGLIAAAKSFSDAGSMLDDMSQRTGDTVENLSAIGYAARQSGAGLEELEAGFGKMSGTIAGAIAGEKASVDLLSKLGLTADDLKGKLPTEQLQILADKLKGISDNDTKIDLVKSIFGKSGTSLIPLLNEGSEGIDKLMQEAQRLGLVMGSEDAAAAAAMGDAMDKLWDTLGGLVNTIGSALAPALTDVLTMITDNVAAASKWISENKGLVIGLGLVAAAATALGIALAGVGVVATVTGALLGGVGALIGALLSPLGLVIAAGAGLIYAFYSWTDAGKEMTSVLGEAFKWLSETAKKTFGGISDALAAGNIKLAVKVLWAGIKVAWQGGIDGINSMWVTAVETMKGVFDGFATYLMKGFSDLLFEGAKLMANLDPRLANDKVTRDAVLRGLGNAAEGARGVLDARFNKREADRQKVIVDAGKPSGKLGDLQNELDALIAQAKLEAAIGKGTGASQLKLEQGRAGAESANKRAASMALGGFAEAGSQGAASSINRSIGLARNPNAGVEAKLDKVVVVLKELIKVSGVNVEEVRLA